MAAADSLITRFVRLGLSEQKAAETLKNANVTKHLTAALDALPSPQAGDLPAGVGMLIYHLATKLRPQTVKHLALLVSLIADQQLDNTVRVDAALEFLLGQGPAASAATVDVAALRQFCGVGVVVTPEQIDDAVAAELAKHKADLLEQRYRFNTGLLMAEVRKVLKWADGKNVKNEIDVQIFDLLGAKTDADRAPVPKVVKKPKEKPAAAAAVDATKADTPAAAASADTGDSAQTIAELMRTKVHFHAPGDNYKTDGYVATPNTERLLQQHLLATGGRVRTRFPPEPNGILHIGHAKAININFGYAAAHGGTCNLRYDDTNPEKEEEKFFVGIRDMVEWLGYKPDQITYSSDNFQQLYEWAVQLIGAGHAYVCHQSADEMKGFDPVPSPWRDRPVAESRALFEDMRNGKIDEGAATLRMKVRLEEGKADPVAYRIKFVHHHRTGDEWCIYPTYDYTHCLCDSIENITHSLCTKEFQSRRSSYYWLCNAVDIYCPVQWEYGRLNIGYTVVSKRKIAKLITSRTVNDWDDPRLYTLTALRRRGFPAEAINAFCAQMGVTGAQATVHPAALDAAVRDHLNVSAARRLVVLQPLKVTLENFPHAVPHTFNVPDFPTHPARGSHTIVWDAVLYIDRSDFCELPPAGYRRLTPSQSVGLRHTGYVLHVNKVICDRETREPVELLCRVESAETAAKPKAFIQWVSQPVEVEVRLYEPLFRHANPEDVNEVPGGFLSDCNPNSLTVCRSYADASILGSKVYDRFQFERIGFFSVDPDSNAERLVFNRTVTLKEDAGCKN